MRRFKGAMAVVGATMLLAGALVMAAPAGAGGNGEKPWPILRVMKTIGQAEYPDKANEVKPPPGTTFYVTVTCDFPNGEAAAAGDPFPTTVLTFTDTGAPDTSDQSGWTKTDGYWTFQGRELKYKECTAIETDVTDPEGNSIIDAPNLFQQYKCDAVATPVEKVKDLADDEADATGNDLEFGCLTPEPFGEYVPQSTQASVQFTAFWDRGACTIVEPEEDVEAETRQFCQETGTLTVDNFDPQWNVVEPVPAPIVIVPTFTG
jgi:hypothetical protein